MKPFQIVIHLELGLIHAVYATEPKAEVLICDTDPEFSERKKEFLRLKRAVRTLNKIY